jgi:L-asparaginase / beta-aspartyl-peptidase
MSGTIDIMNKYAIAIHGGAGAIGDVSLYQASLRAIIEDVSRQAEAGMSALDLVTLAVTKLEDDPLYNAGKGSVLNAEGHIECDASIMDGRDLDAGAVAGVTGIKNPVKLARAVMEKSPHVMLISGGAEAFAAAEGFLRMDESYFITEARVKQLKEAQEKNTITLDHSQVEDKKLGTVGAVAIDMDGNIAAATSTGGVVNKRFGRVGDTPIVGAGVYAENELCAVSATGYGEQFIRTSLGKHIAEWMRYHSGSRASEGATQGIDFLVQRVNGLGGVIVVDGAYQVGVAHSTPVILAASKTWDAETKLYC